MIVPMSVLLLRLPFLKQSITTVTAPLAKPLGGGQKAAYWIAVVFSALIPAILFPTLMDKSAGGLHTLTLIAIVLLVVSVIAAVIGFARSGASAAMRHVGIGGLILAVVSAVMWILFAKADGIVPLSPFFNEPTTNQIVYWALVSASITAFITFAFYYFNKKHAGARFSDYGISLNPMTIVASLCTAVIAVAIGYLLLFVMQAIFGTDFRIWTFAVRTFTVEHFITGLRYMPFFLIYYFVSAVALNADTRSRKGGYLLAIFLNVGGLILWLIAQYGLDFARGVALYPAQNLNGILLFALVPVLVIAAVYARKLFEKTNNVWLPAFVNTILFTLVTVANTVMFWNLV